MLHAAILAAALTPLQLFFRADDAWEARTLPAYVAFDTMISHRDVTGNITRGSKHVVLRTFDHWLATVEIDQGSAQPKTSRGLNCLGPAYSPLGFNISSVYPASTQLDPFVPSALPVIASVRAIHYDVTLAGEERVDAAPAYHLILRPLSAPEHYPLRALWIDETSFQVRKLTYSESGRLERCNRLLVQAVWAASDLVDLGDRRNLAARAKFKGACLFEHAPAAKRNVPCALALQPAPRSRCAARASRCERSAERRVTERRNVDRDAHGSDLAESRLAVEDRTGFFGSPPHGYRLEEHGHVGQLL